MKKTKLLGLLFTALSASLIAACSNPLTKTSSVEESLTNSASLESTTNLESSLDSSLILDSSFSFSEESSFENSDSSEYSSEENSSNGTSSDENSSSQEDSSSTEDEDKIDEVAIAIVDEAYKLSAGEYLDVEIGDNFGGTYTLTGRVTEIDIDYSASKGICLYFVVEGRENRPIYCYQLKGDNASLIGKGDTITVTGKIKNYKGMVEFDKGCLLIDYEYNGTQTDKPNLGEDPYANVSKTQFYMNYSPATSYEDAYYRSLHNLMSGELMVPDQAPVQAEYQPVKNGKYIRNADTLYEDNGNTYIVVDCYGNESFRIYKGGAYITLEEVAAYVYAFGTYPANYTTSKNTSPSSSPWGEYLRVNHSKFSGSTSQYPYEPELPNISGCGGTLYYYEMDIGTTGTDCDPSYPIEIYNDGYSITRGAARIVYGKNDLNGNGIYEIGELHVFYTYNHYNDFQEYLNYEGGWGEMFGNVTGGGTLSSKYDYNPTDYVEVYIESLPKTRTLTAAVEYACFLGKRRYCF